MLKKIILLAVVLMTAVQLKAQNEIGGYLLSSITGIYNSADKSEELYSNSFTMSRGLGVNFIHFYKGRKDTRKHSRYGYRIDLIYQGHSQKWTANYKAGSEIITKSGQTRLDYIKFSPTFEVSHPYTRHLSLILFAGPQISYLIDNDGGLLAYKEGKIYDYFDLPEQSTDYYHQFTIDAVAGMGVDYEFTKWINLTGGLRADLSLTNMDKPNKVVNGTKLYNIEKDRNGSHNYSISLFFGVEYTLHRPEHAKTRF